MLGFGEVEKLQLRIENVQRVFNHPDFFEPDTNLGDNNFGNPSRRLVSASEPVQFGASPTGSSELPADPTPFSADDNAWRIRTARH